MLDASHVSPRSPRPPRARTSRATALVTSTVAGDLEVRVWPPEQVWRVGGALTDAGHDWAPALVDEDGLPTSLLVRREHGAEDEGPADLVADLARTGCVALGYLAADRSGACAQVPGPQPSGRDHVIFVELQQLAYADGWQLRAFGAPGARRRLREASDGLLVVPPPRHSDEHSTVLELPGSPETVHELVARLDRAGLDGHLRVLRHHRP